MTSSSPDPLERPAVRSYAIIDPGSAWTPGTDVFAQDPTTLLAHLDHMRSLFDQGRVLLGGPEDHGHAGFVLLDTADVAEAEALMAADPCVQAGIFRFRLHRLTPYFDRFAGTRHAG